MFEQLKARAVRTLRWSETYTKTNMVYLAKGGFWLALNQGIIMASGLILSVAFANLVPKEVYGTYQFIMAMGTVLAAFTLTGMPTAVMRATAKGSEGALRAGFHTQLRWSVGVAFLGAALAAYYYLNQNNTLALSFLIVGALSPFLGSFGLTKSYLTGKQLFRESALMGLWRRFIPVAAILPTILLTHDPVVIVFVYFVSNTLSAGLLYLLVVRSYRLPHTEEHEMINYSKHLSLLKIFSEVVSQADKVLIWVFLGAAPMAAYTLAQLPVKQLNQVFTLIFSLTFPKITAAKFSELKTTLPHKVRSLLILAGTVVLVYVLAAPFLFKVLFPAYPESVLVSQVLALTLLSRPRSLYGQAFAAHKKKRPMYIMNISGSIITLVSLFILLPLYGMWGAVGAILISHLYSLVLTRYLFAVTT